MDTNTKTKGRVAPWNKGKLLGQKPPLKLKEIWAIRIRLQLDHRARELALFNLAIDSRLRSCDLHARYRCRPVSAAGYIELSPVAERYSRRSHFDVLKTFTTNHLLHGILQFLRMGGWADGDPANR